MLKAPSHVGQDGPQVGLPDVLGVDGLEAQAVDPGQRRQEAAAQEEVGQERTDEEAADLGRGLVLEDQRRDAGARPASRGCSASKRSSSRSTATLWRE